MIKIEVGQTAVARGNGQCKYRITKVTPINVYLLQKESRSRINIKGSIVIPRLKFSTLIASVI